MKNIAIVCETLRDEVRKVVNDLDTNIPVVWVDSGLHDFPDRLNKTIQEQIDKIENVENIILLFGRCGNSIVGLKSSEARLIIPRVDDCISLFLGGDKNKQELEEKAPAYYFTRGYLENEKNIWTEYKYCVNKYGSEKAKKLFHRLFKNYEKLRIIDTGAYHVQDIIEKTNNIAVEFDLNHEIVDGSLEYIYKSFSGNWDENFIKIDSGEEINYATIY